jgi:hypothetical protein
MYVNLYISEYVFIYMFCCICLYVLYFYDLLYILLSF